MSDPTRRMVDEAAKAAGYTIGPVYHGTQSVKRFYKFAGTWNYRFAAEKGTTYFTNNKDVAAGYGVRVVDAYLRMINPLEVDAKGQHWTITSPSALVKAKRDGNDGVIIRNVRDVPAGVPDQVADVYVTFNPSQIKSADPVTYDDNGNVIPLSQRFSSRSEDIRNPKRNPATPEDVPKHYKSVNTFREYWNALGVRNMTDTRGKGTPYEHIRPSEIQVEKANRNKGLGTAFMQDLTEFADLKGMQIRLNPSDELGATSKGRLEKFYKRFGFVENKSGKNKDYAISERFYRQPKRIAMKTKEFRNPVVFPADDITFAAASPTPANVAIAAGKTLWDTPAFKKWFGDSKVRDLANRPMVVYHGTCKAEFTEFDPTKTLELGFHFGTPAQAKDFLKGCGSSRGKTPGIYPVYLSIQNPIFTPDVYSEDPVYLIQWLEKTNHIHEWFPDESDSYYRSMNRLRDQIASTKSDSTLTGAEQYKILKPLRKATSGLLRKIIMRKGYDGIRYKNENEGRTDDPTNIAWVAFSPGQIKSATENIRTFDRRDPDIRNPRRSMIRTKLSRILEPGDRVLDYDRAQGEDLYRLWDMVHTDKPLTKEALVEIEGMLDDDGVLVIQSGEEPSGLQDHFRRATRYQGMLLVQGPMNPEEARINTEKLRRDLE